MFQLTTTKIKLQVRFISLIPTDICRKPKLFRLVFKSVLYLLDGDAVFDRDGSSCSISSPLLTLFFVKVNVNAYHSLISVDVYTYVENSRTLIEVSRSAAVIQESGLCVCVCVDICYTIDISELIFVPFDTSSRRKAGKELFLSSLSFGQRQTNVG